MLHNLYIPKSIVTLEVTLKTNFQNLCLSDNLIDIIYICLSFYYIFVAFFSYLQNKNNITCYMLPYYVIKVKQFKGVYNKGRDVQKNKIIKKSY